MRRGSRVCTGNYRVTMHSLTCTVCNYCKCPHPLASLFLAVLPNACLRTTDSSLSLFFQPSSSWLPLDRLISISIAHLSCLSCTGNHAFLLRSLVSSSQPFSTTARFRASSGTINPCFHWRRKRRPQASTISKRASSWILTPLPATSISAR